MTVLHLHMSASPILPSGPEYSYPGGSAGTVNAARDDEPMPVHTRRRPTPLPTRGLQPSGDFTRRLTDRVK